MFREKADISHGFHRQWEKCMFQRFKFENAFYFHELLNTKLQTLKMLEI